MDLDGLNRRLLVLFLALSFFICHSCDVWRVGLIDSQREQCFETTVGKISISLNHFGWTFLDIECEGEYQLYPDAIKASWKDNSRNSAIGSIWRNYLHAGPGEKEPFIANNEHILIEILPSPPFRKFNLEIDLTEFIKDVNGEKVFDKPFTLTF